MTFHKHSHCSYCGTAFAPEQPWPRQCSHCQSTSYQNPLPVAVLLVPVDAGVLVVRRAIPPRQGQLALPGGFIGVGESWQAAAARELVEETGMTVDATTIRLFDVHSAPDGTVLIFGLAAALTSQQIPSFSGNHEVSELVIVDHHCELAFPLHTLVLQRYFATTSSLRADQPETRQ